MPNELVAARSLAWTDVDKFTFLWDYDLVIVYVYPEIGAKKVITDHDFEVLREIYVWLDSKPVLPSNPFEFEGEYGAEENRY